MKFNVGRRGAREELEEREVAEFLFARAALGGLLGGDSGTSTQDGQDGGLLGGVLGGGSGKTSVAPTTSSPAPASDSPAASTVSRY